MRISHSLVTAATDKPITGDDVVRQLRLPENDDPTSIDLYIDSAINMAEDYLGVAFVSQQWKLLLDDWPSSREDWWDGVRHLHRNELRSGVTDITLPRYPLITVDTILVEGNSITVSDYFLVDTDRKRGRLSLKAGQSLPAISSREANVIEITYTSGFGASGADVPAVLRLALLQLAAYLYENRGECSSGDALIESGAKPLLDKYKVYDL